METSILKLNEADWTCLETAHRVSEEVLDTIFSDRAILCRLLESLANNRQLIGLCEHYDFFDKLILYRDPAERFRLRLHIFLPEASHRDRPHNHRWNYSSVIMAGGYQHFIYGTEDQISAHTRANDLTPILAQRETRGSVYTLSHNVFHSVAAEPYTVSLMVRGPVVKERFLVLDKKTDTGWWEYGRESETIEEQRRKAMLPERTLFLIKKLGTLGVI